MSELPQSTWLEIAKQSVYLPQDAQDCVGRYIAVDALRRILRKSRRSHDQNSLIHALFDEALERGGETLGGWTKDDIKEWALGEYWGWEEQKALGRTRLKPKRRSSRLSKTEMGEFIDWFVRTMAEHGIVLELPGEQAA